MSKMIKGKCLCGSVEYEIENSFNKFHICHCEQCRRITGSAFASNLFGDPKGFKIVAGAKSIKRYGHKKRDFTKAFCIECGSGVPYLNSGGNSIVIPAGSLDQEPEFSEKSVIFCKETAGWSSHNEKDSYFDGFPF